MRIRLIIPLSLLAAAILFSMLMISGCGNLDIEGPEPGNNTPWVKWAITPSDSMVHSFNPALQWFGGDTDGLINDYMYGVFQAAYMDSAARETSLEIPDTLTWISLGIVTEATIPLVASPDSSVSVGQYVVMRGVDDQGDTSNVINRYLLRTNNRPTCIVNVPENPQWVLPDTTSTWFGIPITWDGGDSLDYPGAQPDGPYASRSSAELDSADFNPDTAPFYDQLTDLDDDSLRILATGSSFRDLRTGFYIIYVRNYDDANVPSAPALGIFEVYEPLWIIHPNEAKDILLVDHNRYYPLSPPTQSRWGELPPVYRDSVDRFYIEMVENAGFTSADYDVFDTHVDTFLVDKPDLYRYRMVIALDTDWNLMIPLEQQAAYTEYLGVGGKIWVIGRRSFETTAVSGRQDYPLDDDELPYLYLNLEASVLNRVADRDVVEFNGATPLMAPLPILNIDTLRVSYTSWALNDYSEALFGIGSLIRFGGSETVYIFRSVDPNNATYHDFPVAVRYDAGTYKTSYFAFPLYFIEDAAAFQAAEVMLDWFLQE
jgi:hypothetical protein